VCVKAPPDRFATFTPVRDFVGTAPDATAETGALDGGKKSGHFASMTKRPLPPVVLVQALETRTQSEVADLLDVNPRQVRRWLLGEGAPKSAYLAVLANELAPAASRPFSSFQFIDLFAGIGGLRRAFSSHGGECVFTSEWDKYAVRTYEENFPEERKVAGDITAIAPESIPDHDLLLAGFPCQPFSLAGVSKKNSLGRAHGFLDKTQGTLFFNVINILRAKQPKAFLLENVKNLRSHDGGHTYEVIRGALEELGYHVYDRIIDSRPWVPQRRERIFLVGFRKATRFSFEDMAIPGNGPRLREILHSADEQPESHFTKRVTGRTVVDDRYTLSDHLWGYLQAYAAKHRAAGNGFGCSVFGPEDVARTLSARYHKDGSEILIAQRGKNPRRLTPRECARLMGFDMPGREAHRIPSSLSDTQAYRQFGNSVVVPVVEEIARVMVPRMLHPERFRPLPKTQLELLATS
jgi:DNA (cytosine-5)-methyltransferase 1